MKKGSVFIKHSDINLQHRKEFTGEMRQSTVGIIVKEEEHTYFFPYDNILGVRVKGFLKWI